MSEVKLLKCPFCGGELKRNMWGSLEDTNKECILYGFEIHEKMMSMWNTRTPIDELIETLEEMRDANGLASQTETCKFLLNYIKQIGLYDNC